MAHASFAQLLTDALEYGTIGAAVMTLEAEESGCGVADVEARFAEAIGVMEQAIERGMSGEARSRSGLVGGDAARVAAHAPALFGEPFDRALASALATVEVNAAMGRIVAAPTAGASGVVPAVLFTVAERIGAGREALVRALAAAGGIGAVIAARASLAGASGGCQAEVGSAAAMAAAAATELAGGTAEQAGHAGSLALQGLLGLVCDPVGGLVEVPCVVRNATGAAVAMAAVEMALAGVTFPIPFDEVVDAAASVGRSLPPSLRETAIGGLAGTPTAKRCAGD
jgi:L-serine dehydratase